MSTDEIIAAAINRAIKNGYVLKLAEAFGNANQNTFLFYSNKHYYNIIFSHEFAKAFWGEKDYWHETACTCGGVDFHIAGFDAHTENCAKLLAERGYLFHLQQMVREENPAIYLEQFIKE